MNQKTKGIALICAVVSALALAGCGTTTNRTMQTGEGAPALRIGYFSSFDANVYARLQKSGAGWKVMEISPAGKPLTPANDTQEVVALDRTGSRVQPAYSREFSQFNKQGELSWFDCSELLSGLSMGGSKYSGCSSSAFNKIDAASTLGKNVFAIPLTLGIAAGTKRKVDAEAMEHALKSSNAYSLMREYSKVLMAWDEGQRKITQDVARLKQSMSKGIKVDGNNLLPPGATARPNLTMVEQQDRSKATIPELATPGAEITMDRMNAYRQEILAASESSRANVRVAVSCAPKSGGFDFRCSPAPLVVGLADAPPQISATVTGNAEYLANVESRRLRDAIDANIALTRRLDAAGSKAGAGPEIDPSGKRIIRGTVSGGYYDSVHIISSGVGVDSSTGNTTITNSTIDADICVVVGMSGITVQNSELNCRICAVQNGPPLGNVFTDNRLACQDVHQAM